MCDTFVALKNTTRDGSVIFGKNSDREPNEAHELRVIPHETHAPNTEVTCTYITIPQAPETNAVLLSKPFWIWGAEMGANEHGVVIGNEAVFTKVPYDKQPGLIGMDFLRLALERAATSDEALEEIITLLEIYGQGGNCGMAHSFYYHNSFLIADPESAWVLETAGRHWAAEKVRDIRSISNVITIGSSWDRASENLVSHAISKGWCQDEEDFDFGRCYSDLIYSEFGAGRYRVCRSKELLEEKSGEIDVPYAMRVLRDHGSEADDDWQPGKGLLGAEVCMHASFGPIRGSQTTGSMVSHLTDECDTHWVTGTAAPCTSIFKPVWIDADLPSGTETQPTGTYDQSTRWWRHENLHRELLRDYATRIFPLQSKRDSLEAAFLKDAVAVGSKPLEDRRDFTESCFEAADHMEAESLAQVQEMPIERSRAWLHRLALKRFDKKAHRFP
jgi:dipeptidase